jgi:hypothetical protein
LRHTFFILVSFCLSVNILFAQGEIPIGTWRIHASAFDITDIQLSDSRIVASGKQAIFIINKTQQEITVLNKLNRLSAANISAFAYDESKSLLLVGYTDGNIDLVSNSRTLNFPEIRNALITSGKRINHIIIKEQTAYLSADFGVVVFDMQQQAIRETIREIGPQGTSLKINKAIVLADSIFLATANGILASRSDGTVNLLDFNNWKRFDQGLFEKEIKAIEVFNNKVWAGIDDEGLFSYSNGKWQFENAINNANFKDIRAGGAKLNITTDELVYQYDQALSVLNTTLVLKANTSVSESENTIWIADAFLGLVKKQGANEERIAINSPLSDEIFSVQNSSLGMLALRGGFNAIKQKKDNPAQLSIFNTGLWAGLSAYEIQGIQKLSPCNDLVAFVETGRANPAYMISCFGQGIQAYDKNWNKIDIQTDALSNAKVIDLKRSGDKIWIASYDDQAPLISYNADGSFTNYSFNEFPSARYIQQILIDARGYLWMTIDPIFGGGILLFDPQQQQSRLITEQANNGSMPDRRVYAMANDRKGDVWIGTHQGVCYFSAATDYFTGNLNAIRPIFENRFLLRDQRINAIAIDGGNRKWISSNNGVWLFAADGESQVNYFNATNSPLPGNEVQSIAIVSSSGEVFFVSTSGLSSYRSDATTSTAKYETVKIFPNPVTGNFSGTVGISGLAENVNVKITDISGKLIWETQANGGTASWHMRDLNGARVGSGIYLVFSASSKGRETQVGKIAVVN